MKLKISITMMAIMVFTSSIVSCVMASIAFNLFFFFLWSVEFDRNGLNTVGPDTDATIPLPEIRRVNKSFQLRALVCTKTDIFIFVPFNTKF